MYPHNKNAAGIAMKPLVDLQCAYISVCGRDGNTSASTCCTFDKVLLYLQKAPSHLILIPISPDLRSKMHQVGLRHSLHLLDSLHCTIAVSRTDLQSNQVFMQ